MTIKLFENLPLIIFGLIFFVSLVFLIIGALASATAQDTIKLAKGKKILMRAVYSFSSLLLVVIVFSTITWFLDKNVEDTPVVNLDSYPSSPVDPNFPSVPDFIKISNHYFNGPYSLQNYNQIFKPAIFSVLCKNEEDYDIIDIDGLATEADLTQHENFSCWSSVCEDIYIGILWKPTGEKTIWNERETVKLLKNENNLLCPIEE